MIRTSSSLGLSRSRISGAINPVAVVSNLLLLTLGTGIAQVLMAVSVLLTARQLGSAQFGGYAAGFSAAGLMAVLFNLGCDNWLLQGISRNPEKLEELLGSALAIKASIGLPWIIGMVLTFPYLNPQTFNQLLVLISALSVWMEGFFAIGLSVFRALLRNQVTAILLIGARGGVLLVTAILVAADVQSVTAYALGRLIVTAMAAFMSVLLLPVRPNVHLATLRAARREVLPFALSDLLTSIYTQADTTIIAFVLSKEAVGLYAPASSLINALYIIPSTLFFVAVPTLVRKLKTDRRSFNRACGAVSAGFLVIGIVLWLIARYASSILLTLLLGDSFKEAGPLLSIMSPILLLKSSSFAAAAILVSVGWQNRRVYVQAISVIANVALNLAIIRQFGVIGVAVVYVISEIILLLGYTSLVIGWIRRGRRSFSIYR